MFGLIAAAAWTAAASGQTYGNWLLTREISRHPQLNYASIDLDAPSGGHFEAGTTKAGGSRVTHKIADGLGQTIGTLTLVSSKNVRSNEAEQVAAEIARRTYSSAVLGEPVPFTSEAFPSATGDRLIQQELDREPTLVTIAFHVAIPGRANQIIASNFGRIGKPADKDDQRVITTSSVLQEVTNGGKRLAVELPLQDRAGRLIGALSTSFLIGPDGTAGAFKSAVRVQHDLSRRIPRLESLAH